MTGRYALIFSLSLSAILVPALILVSWRRSDPAEPEAEFPAVHASAPEPDDDPVLGRLLAMDTSTSARDLGTAELKRGLALWQGGDTRGAVGAFERTVEIFPQFGDWARALGAGAAAQAGDTATARRLLAAAGPVLAQEWGWRDLVRAHRAAGDTVGAARLAGEAAGLLQDPARRAEAWKVLGEIRLQRGDTAGAVAAFRRAPDEAPYSAHAVDAARALGDLPGLTPADRLEIGRLYLRHGNFERGIEGLRAYLATGAGEPAARAGVRLEVGRAHFRARQYRDAERTLLPLAAAAETPRGVAAEALYYAGRSQYRQGREEAARITLERVADRYPAETVAADALYILADLDHDGGRIEAARQRYARAMEAQPHGEKAALSAMRIGGLHFRAGAYRDAAAVFERYRDTHPTGASHEQATYWSARALLKAGDPESAGERLRELVAANPVSYYGMRAADLLGEATWHAALAPSPGTGAEAVREVANAMIRVEVLRELEIHEAIAFELERVQRHFRTRETALYALAEALNARGEILIGIQLGREIQRRAGTWNERLLRIVYPFPYQERIVAESKKNGLDPFFVAGLIRQESMFNARAVSPAGAIGLMQVMPSTGKRLARKAGLRQVSAQQLKDPDLNIRLGTIFLADLLAEYDRKVADALAAYNAGPTRMARWRNFPEYGDVELFTERIPFDETRDYVKVVQQNARIYAALYGGKVRSGD